MFFFSTLSYDNVLACFAKGSPGNIHFNVILQLDVETDFWFPFVRSKVFIFTGHKKLLQYYKNNFP